MSNRKWLRGERIIALLISIFFLLFYLYFQSSSIYGGDSGDLVVASYVHGVAHPPGYPLYTFLGWLLTKIPYSTIAWRVSLLSSVPAAISLGLLFLILNIINKSKIISAFSVLIFGFTYLFWLYAILPEVFSFYLLIVTVFIYLVIKFSSDKHTRHQQLLILCLLFGLALAHHHTILFIIPAIIYYIYPYLKKLLISQTPTYYLKLISYFSLGLLPYVYVLIASNTNPPVNWENPRNPVGFIRLITRAIYGSFKSNSVYFPGISDRFEQVKLFFISFANDFSKLGLILALIGLIYLYKNNKRLLNFTLFAFLLSGPIYLVYAGFPTFTNFHLGTIERFLLVPYVFFIIWLSAGLKFMTNIIDNLVGRLIINVKMSSAPIFILLPISLFFINYPKMLVLKNDRTAENLGIDILQSAPDNSLILIKGDDTAYFDTTYVYYAYNTQQRLNNKFIIAPALLENEFYRQVISYQYPSIIIPSNYKNLENPFLDFVEANKNKFPIYSLNKIDLGNKFFWLPNGLLFRLYETDKIPVSEIKSINEQLFSIYHDPLDGALASYEHLLLSDVLRIYSTARYEAGKIFLISQEYLLAEKYFKESLRIQPELLDNRFKLIEAYLDQKKCNEAKSDIENLGQQNSKIIGLTELNAIYEKVCLK